MTLVKTKGKAPSHRNKVSGAHHRRNDKYMKTYWPYIPIFIILGGSALAGAFLPNSLKGNHNQYGARIESLMGSNNALILDGLYFILFVLVIWYLIRHFKRINSLVVQGEQYLARHYVLDILAGLLIGSLYVLVR